MHSVETADLINLESDSPPHTPKRDFKRLQSEDNQYVTMTRSCTLNPELLAQLTEQRPAEEENFPPDADDADPTGGYLTMRSCPIHLQQQLADLGLERGHSDMFTIGGQREAVPSYGTVRQRIESTPGEAHHLIDTTDDAADLTDPSLTPVLSSSATAAFFPSQYSFATATLNERGGGNAAPPSSSVEEAIVPSSVRFIYQRPTPTSTANTTAAETSTASVRLAQGDGEPHAPPIPSRPGRGHNIEPHSTSTPPMIRGKLKSEGDASAASGERPPAIPPRMHPSHNQQQHRQVVLNVAADGTGESEKTDKPKKPPLPPPRSKTLPPKPTPLPRSGGGGSQSSAAAALSETEIRIQTLILSDPEFQSCGPEVCLGSLKKHKYDLSATKEEIRVHMLMEMQVAYIDAEDCRRALSHCQQKTDRAAAWLLEQSDDIGRRRQ